jgi:hypothetical protein
MAEAVRGGQGTPSVQVFVWQESPQMHGGPIISIQKQVEVTHTYIQIDTLCTCRLPRSSPLVLLISSLGGGYFLELHIEPVKTIHRFEQLQLSISNLYCPKAYQFTLRSNPTASVDMTMIWITAIFVYSR